MKAWFSSFLVFLSLAASSAASVTVQFEFEALRGSDGLPVGTGVTLNVSTVVLLVADSDKSGAFSSPVVGNSLSVGSSFGATPNSDRIFHAVSIPSGSSGFVSGQFTVDHTDLGLNAETDIQDTKWALFWFPGATLNGTIATDQSYGVFHSSTLPDYTASGFSNPDQAMVMPANGTALVTTFYYDQGIEPDGVSTPSVSQFSANLVVIPEPSALVMTLLGSAALLRRRRA